MTLWGLDSTAWSGGVESASSFWGLDATAWAAFAAIGSFLAALLSLLAATFTHWGSGARPKVGVDLATLASDSLSRRGVKAQPNADFWSNNGIEGVIVRIENAGRTPLTADKPLFECMDPWTKRRPWQRKKRRTIGTTALPFEGLVTDFPMRIEPHDMRECFLELAPLFGDPGKSSRHMVRDWHHVRVRVKVAGRRDVVVRRRPIPAAPHLPQLSGEPITLLQFLSRYFLRWALLRADVEGRDAALFNSSALPWILMEVQQREGRLTVDNIKRLVLEFIEESDDELPMYHTLAYAVHHAGFMEEGDLRPKSPTEGPTS